jgi:acyl-CoA thioesterase
VPAAFVTETAVRQVGDGRYAAHLAPAWNLRPLPQGGVVTAVALRAMADHLGVDPDSDAASPRLRTLHTTFVGQVAHGELEVDVELLRRGRSMSHLRAEVRNVGAARGHVTTAVFGTSRPGFEFSDVVAPVVPPPGNCPSFRDPPPPEVPVFDPMPFWASRVEGRAALGHAPWEQYVPETSERAMWFRFDEVPWRPDGTLDPFALVVLADTMPGAVSERVGRSERPWFGPSVDLSVHLLDDCRSDWVLAHNRARHAGDGYASVEMVLWDPGTAARPARPVAYATQVLFFTFLDPAG